jgi:hypothetical protein
MDGPGTITWEEFVANAEEFAKASDRLADHWLFLGDKVGRFSSEFSLLIVRRSVALQYPCVTQYHSAFALKVLRVTASLEFKLIKLID